LAQSTSGEMGAAMLKALMIAALTAASITTAGAVDLTTPITQFDGKPLVTADGKPDPHTLGRVIADTLIITEQGLAAADKTKRYWLAHKIYGKTEVTFTPEELVLIKEVLFKYQSILVAGQAVRLLDPSFKPSKE